MIKILITLLLLLTFSFTFAAEDEETKYHIELSAFPPGGGFTLDCEQGKCALDDYRGKVVILFFGYVSCPDVCPTTFQKIQTTLQLLVPADQQHLKVVFVTLDPLRDTPKMLKEYLGFFKLPAVGLYGTELEIEKVLEQYAGQYKKIAYAGSALGYGIDHSAAIYLIDRTGKLRSMLRHATSPDFLALSIRKLLAEF